MMRFRHAAALVASAVLFPLIVPVPAAFAAGTLGRSACAGGVCRTVIVEQPAAACETVVEEPPGDPCAAIVESHEVVEVVRTRAVYSRRPLRGWFRGGLRRGLFCGRGGC